MPILGICSLASSNSASFRVARWQLLTFSLSMLFLPSYVSVLTIYSFGELF